MSKKRFYLLVKAPVKAVLYQLYRFEALIYKYEKHLCILALECVTSR